MATTIAASNSQPPKTGDFVAPGQSDLRSPCPALNILANHGYLPRDGRNITFDQLVHAITSQLGVGIDVATAFAAGALTVNNGSATDGNQEHASSSIDDHFSLKNLKTSIGVRPKDQVDSAGHPYINLDQTRLHRAIEHDVSLVRRDAAQGDNYSVQPDLVAMFLTASSDGKYITKADFAKFRSQRLEMQKRDNPGLVFGKMETTMAFGECALIAGVLGDPLHDFRVAVEQLRAFIGEERLPCEGWEKRLLPLSLAELTITNESIRRRAKDIRL